MGQVLWEPADAARELEVTPKTIHNLVRRGLLRIIATTPRGTRLLDPAAVAALARRRRTEQ